MGDLPALDPDYLLTPTLNTLDVATPSTHAPRFLILYGSLRERSYSRFAAEEADRILKRFGGEVRYFDPRGLPPLKPFASIEEQVSKTQQIFNHVDPVLGGYGTKRFLHTAFALPPSGVVPPVLMGAVERSGEYYRNMAMLYSRDGEVKIDKRRGIPGC